MRNMLQRCSPRGPVLCLLLAVGASLMGAEQICPSTEVRSVQDLVRLRDCRIVAGHVSLLQFDLSATPSNANLSSAVEEISDYLLVYRVQGLATLRRIFPRLAVVRGRELLFGRYALTVHENRDLHDLGLERFARVQHGAIRIEANPQLCYVDTVDWVHLLGNSSAQHFTLKLNQMPDNCPLCRDNDRSNELPADGDSDSNDDDDDVEKHAFVHCWAYELPQRRLSSDTCACLSQCEADGECAICAQLRLNGRCVERCPDTHFELYKRDCVNATLCRKRGLIPHDGICALHCPPHYKQLSGTSPDQASCAPICAGNYVVRTDDDLEALQDCTQLNGTLTIELAEIKSKIVERLQQALGRLREVTGYVRVQRSPQLVSLSFLSHLDTIGGAELIDSKYALYVVDNQHLEQVWAPRHNVAVLSGHVYFHLNPRLCYEKILQLEASLHSGAKISIVDASPNSNGERVVCGSAVRTINATIEEFNSTAARVKVDHVTAEDKDLLLGYLHHYKEEPHNNITMYDGRHGCGHDNWLMDISPTRNVRHIISNLKPYTRYAYFVRTITMTDYHRQMAAYSEIRYFRTLPSQPGPVARVYYKPLTETKILLHWWPPLRPNGIITHYLVSFERVAAPSQNETGRNYKSPSQSRLAQSTECDCQEVDPFWSGAAPADENYYSKEQMVYDEALTNLVYFSYRRPDDQYSTPTPTTPTATVASVTTTSVASATTTSVTSATTTSIATTTSSVSITSKAAPVPAHNEVAGTLPSDNQTVSLKDDEGEKGLEKFHKELEMKALAEQDTGSRHFPIVKPIPRCVQPNATVQHQLENSCKNEQQFEGRRLPGDVHAFKLTDLEPTISYRISVRACVDDLWDSCSVETVLLAKTLSKPMEQFFRNLRPPTRH